jgi:hypothetical protein
MVPSLEEQTTRTEVPNDFEERDEIAEAALDQEPRRKSIFLIYQLSLTPFYPQ